MKRDFYALRDEATFDCIVIGGGIYGAASAYYAARAGLSVLLVEKRDFGWATSSQSARIAHSGMRYLQHLDLLRLRESVRERAFLRRSVGYLTREVPFLLPTYSSGVSRHWIVSVYLKAFDFLRDFFLPSSRRSPATASSRSCSPEEHEELARYLEATTLTGGACWPETQVTHTERLVMAYLHSAAQHGAVLLNYCAATSLHVTDGSISSTEVRDEKTGQTYKVSARVVINATGPWVARTLEPLGIKLQDFHQSKAFTLVTRPIAREQAISFNMRSMYSDEDAVINKGSSVQFVIPWTDYNMIASMHLAAASESPEDIIITEAEIDHYIASVNDGVPGLHLERKDVIGVLWGMIPAMHRASPSPLKHYKIVDHRRSDAINGLITVIGVKFTTAAHVAREAVSLAGSMLGRTFRNQDDLAPLWGGEPDTAPPGAAWQRQASEAVMSPVVSQRLREKYGSQLSMIEKIATEEPSLRHPVSGTDTIRAEVAFSVREECAIHLADFVFRRAALGIPELPAHQALVDMAETMGAELGWSAQERDAQLAQVHEEARRSLTRYS